MPDRRPIDPPIEALRADFRARLAVARPPTRDLKALHDEFLSRKSGSVTGLLKTLGTLPPEARREFGALVNALKTEIETALDEQRAALDAVAAAGRRRRRHAARPRDCRSVASIR